MHIQIHVQECNPMYLIQNCSRLKANAYIVPFLDLKFKIVNKGIFKREEAGLASSYSTHKRGRVWWVHSYLQLAVL